MMNLNKKQQVFGLALLVMVGVIVWQGRFVFRGRSVEHADRNGDPFTNLIMPEDYAKDPATKAVLEEKVADLKTMYAEKPEIWETWIAIGNLRRLFRDYEGAIAAYQRSIELQNNNILGQRNIAEVYSVDLHKYEEAAARYRLAIANNFSDPDLYIQLGFLYHSHLGNNEEAEKIYIQGLQKTGFNSGIYIALIEFYKATGNTEKYRENVAVFLKQHPDNVQYQKAYGGTLQ